MRIIHHGTRRASARDGQRRIRCRVRTINIYPRPEASARELARELSDMHNVLVSIKPRLGFITLMYGATSDLCVFVDDLVERKLQPGLVVVLQEYLRKLGA